MEGLVNRIIVFFLGLGLAIGLGFAGIIWLIVYLCHLPIPK